MLKKPTFFIVGAAKSGTTSLYHYLSQHDDIYMSPVKEPRFFALMGTDVNFKGPKDDIEINTDTVTELFEYEQLFKDVTNEEAVGEASVLYLYSKVAVKNIKKYIPDAKIIIILRNPVDRAYSAYKHNVRNGSEDLKNFMEAFYQGEIRTNQLGWRPFWDYKGYSLYYNQVLRYFEEFDRDRIKVYIYEECIDNYEFFLKDMLEFLGVSSDYKLDISIKHNESLYKVHFVDKLVKSNFYNFCRRIARKVIPSNIRHVIAKKIRSKQYTTPPKLSNEVRHKIMDEFRDDIYSLQKLIDKDLSVWLKYN